MGPADRKQAGNPRQLEKDKAVRMVDGIVQKIRGQQIVAIGEQPIERVDRT
jgi:hypothetical protein